MRIGRWIIFERNEQERKLRRALFDVRNGIHEAAQAATLRAIREDSAVAHGEAISFAEMRGLIDGTIARLRDEGVLS